MIQTVTPCYLKEKLLNYEMSKLLTPQQGSAEDQFNSIKIGETVELKNFSE